MARNSPKKQRQPEAKKPSRRARSEPLTVDPASLPVEPYPNPPLVWVDRMEINVRLNPPLATLRFHSALPDRLSEVCRLQCSQDHLRRMVDVICRSIGYYPTKSQS